MSLIHDIAELLLREGEIKGQAAREQIAEQEEMRQSKHRLLKNTLKGLAMFGPMFIPGGGIVPALSHASRVASVATKLAPLAGTIPAGLGYSQFAGPMTRDDWYRTPWDEEGIG